METELQAFLARIENKDPDVRVAAAHDAASIGAPAVVPLGERMASPDPGIAKSAGEALKVIVHHSARPGAQNEAKSVSHGLTQLLAPGHPRKVRSEAAHLLGFAGGDEAVPPLAHLLSDPEMQEEARLALERIPGSASTQALQRSLQTAPADFRPNIEQSLRHKHVRMTTVGTEK